MKKPDKYNLIDLIILYTNLTLPQDQCRIEQSNGTANRASLVINSLNKEDLSSIQPDD